MTRPMPGPPVCCCPGSPHECPQSRGSQLRMLNLRCPACELHNGDRNDRARLTGSECAAEYWRAKADLGAIEAVLVSPALIKARVRVWHRFATLPHEGAGNLSADDVAPR